MTIGMKKAQNMLEYVITLTAIIVAVVALAKGPVSSAVRTMINDSAQFLKSFSLP